MPPIEEKTVYACSDGKVFETENNARIYERILAFKTHYESAPIEGVTAAVLLKWIAENQKAVDDLLGGGNLFWLFDGD